MKKILLVAICLTLLSSLLVGQSRTLSREQRVDRNQDITETESVTPNRPHTHELQDSEARGIEQQEAEQRTHEQRTRDFQEAERRAQDESARERRLHEQREAEQRGREQREREAREADRRLRESREREQRLLEQREAEQRAREAEQRIREQRAREERERMQRERESQERESRPGQRVQPVQTNQDPRPGDQRPQTGNVGATGFQSGGTGRDTNEQHSHPRQQFYTQEEILRRRVILTHYSIHMLHSVYGYYNFFHPASAVFHRLYLTHSQLNHIDNVTERLLEQIEDKRKEIFNLEERIAILVRQDRFDEIRRLKPEINALNGEISLLTVDHFEAIYRDLSLWQRQILLDFMNERNQAMRRSLEHNDHRIRDNFFQNHWTDDWHDRSHHWDHIWDRRDGVHSPGWW